MTDVERKVIEQAVHGELGAAMVQMIEDDDQIICNHVREAHRMLSKLLSDTRDIAAVDEACVRRSLRSEEPRAKGDRWEGWQL